MNVILVFIKKELTQAIRDKKMRFILFVSPLIQLLLFGFAVTTEIKNISLLAIDYDQTAPSRDLIASIFSSGYFRQVFAQNIYSETPYEFLQTGRARAAIVIPSDFSKNIERDERGEAQLIIDGSDANSARVIKGYFEQIVFNFGQELLKSRTRPANIKQDAIVNVALSIKPQVQIWYNPELKSSHFMVPGVICMILLIMTAMLSGMAITRERETGTLEQIIVSPIQRGQYVLGKMIPFVFVGLVQVVLILTLAKVVFAFPMRGNLLLFFFGTIIFLFTTLGLGLIVSTVSKTQAQVMLTIMPIAMPGFLLSGFFFPISSIPIALRWIAYINPITYFLIIVRGILLKGLGFFDIYREILILVIFGLLFIGFGIMRIKKKID